MMSTYKVHDQAKQIIDGIATFNDKVVSAELLISLQRHFPTTEEIIALRQYDGPLVQLGKTERFLVQLLAVSDITQRIEYFLYKLEFGRAYRSIQTKVKLLRQSCRDLVDNFFLVDALEKVSEQCPMHSSMAL
ncbi:hypothetical protein PINS_up003082 [Pythium insidiosum]|nr:hypothetical protein PINS_up003082 [Pythium insidiosum]